MSAVKAPQVEVAMPQRWCDTTDDDVDTGLESITSVALNAGGRVLTAEGVFVLVTELKAGDRLLVLDHAAQSMTASSVLGFLESAEPMLVLDQADVAVFAEEHRWSRQVLPAELLKKLPKVEMQCGTCLLNAGSQWHGHDCTPCPWALTRGCRDGLMCGFCHCQHPNLSRSAMRRRAQKATCSSQLSELSAFMDEAALSTLTAICMEAATVEKPGDDASTDAASVASDDCSSTDGSVSEEDMSVSYTVKNTFINFTRSRADRRRSRSAPARVIECPSSSDHEDDSLSLECAWVRGLTA
jgi:hypothetical protein